MELLKQSTAFTETVGPILDSAGAEYTGAVIGDLSISKNGTEAAMAAAATLTHISNGHYTLVGTTGNSDTLGRTTIRCNKSTYQMPPKEYMVLPATVFDALVTNAAGGANGLLLSLASNQVDVGKFLGTAPTEDAAGRLAGGITKFFNVASPTGTVNSLPDALPGAAGGVFIAGSNAATTAATWTVSGASVFTGNVSYADGLTIAAPSTANRPGLSITGNGSGHGILATSGLTGTGLRVTGATGANITGTGANGLLISGTGTGVGLRVTGGATAAGVEFVGGATSGDALSLAMTSGVGLRADSITVTNVLTVSGATTLTGAVTASNASNNIVGIDVAKISGDSSAADNAEAFFDGTGYAGTNNVIPTVTNVTNLHASAATAANQTTINNNVLLTSTQVSVDAVKVDTAAIKLKTDNLPASPAAVGSAMTLTSGERDSIAAALLDLANGVESGKTMRQAMRLMAAALAGKRSNSGTASEQFDAIGSPGTARIVGNADAAGDGTPTLTP